MSKLKSSQILHELISALIQSGDLSLVRIVELLGISQRTLTRRLIDYCLPMPVRKIENTIYFLEGNNPKK